jgi:Lar family restriction alleviation protein
MSYKIPDSMQKALKDNLITYVIPEPKIETESQPDGSTKLVVGWDTKDLAYAISAIVQQMNEAFDDAIIEEFAASNGYVKKSTCHCITGLKPWSELEPKPCPFCGGRAKVYETNLGVDCFSWWNVECNDCEASMEGFGSERVAIRAWNTRVEEVG